MKVTYLLLENVAGLYVGSNIDKIEIDFSKSINKIIAIQGLNGLGKSVLLSSISPFANITSIDDRSSLSYIREGYNGRKEIHYVVDDNVYIIKHYYKATKSSHTIKSYISKNNEELNINGNVTSFVFHVENELGLTQDMMRLIRIGSNVNSFIGLTPTRRKEYIGKLIHDIDGYQIIFKDINDDIKVVKTLKSTNNTNMYNCHISDLTVEEEKLETLSKRIISMERDRDKLISKLGKIKALIQDNDINDLRRKYAEAESSLKSFNDIEESIKSLSLENVSVDTLIRKRSDISDRKINVQSKINSYRISIDNTLKNIERLEINIKKITSNNDITSLIQAITSLRDTISNTSIAISKFVSTGIESSEIKDVINTLSGYNQISQMIYTLGNKPIEVYLKLKAENRSVDKFLKDQMKKSYSRLNDNNIKLLLDNVFGNNSIIEPNCVSEYEQCPYFRLSSVINDIKNKLDEESLDDETLRYIQIISNNIDNILNTMDILKRSKLPSGIKSAFKEESILNRLRSKLPFFDLSDIQDFLIMVTEHELYVSNVEQLKQYEYQLSVYRQAGIDSQMNEMKQLKESVSFYRSNIATLSSDINKINEELSNVDYQIALVSKYNDSKKYRKIIQSTLENTSKLLGPLESANNEKMELEFSLRQTTNGINVARDEHKRLETKLNDYKRLMKESEELDEKLRDLNIILKTVSTKEGIPVKLMKKYLKKIRKLTNELLSIIFNDTFTLGKFNVDEDTFEIPYIRNGSVISDIRYSSQSELALSTLALSLAISANATGVYNVLLLDEVDSGLDDNNRSSFLKMLYRLIDILKAEQVFIISHNMSQMINIPMDVIRMSDTGIRSKMQNIIYDMSN